MFIGTRLKTPPGENFFLCLHLIVAWSFIALFPPPITLALAKGMAYGPLLSLATSSLIFVNFEYFSPLARNGQPMFTFLPPRQCLYLFSCIKNQAAASFSSKSSSVPLPLQEIRTGTICSLFSTQYIHMTSVGGGNFDYETDHLKHAIIINNINT